MKFKGTHKVPLWAAPAHLRRFATPRRHFTSFFKKLTTTTRAGASVSGGNGNSQGDSFLVPGATVATLLMLGALHARRLYDDKKVEEAREKGVETEFHPDVKASFLRLLPLRLISRCCGCLANVELPVWLRPHIYRAWAQAFHSDLEEAALPLDQYASLRAFFVRKLKDGSRPFNQDSQCLVSPVDGIILRFGELKGGGAIIEQVKGCSYSVTSLLGASSLLPLMADGDTDERSSKGESTSTNGNKKSWWKISLASPKVRDPSSACPVKGLFYCVIYLKPGDYHRIHSPVDWQVLVRRHFSGHLFPVNERATRTIKNLYAENERVVLEGVWKEGFMAIAAVGATNIGSIELFIEPELHTNSPRRKLIPSDPPDERVYEPEGVGIMLRKGDEVAAFNMGSTVVLIFQAPVSKSNNSEDSKFEFNFDVKRGNRIRAGEALGRWSEMAIKGHLSKPLSICHSTKWAHDGIEKIRHGKELDRLILGRKYLKLAADERQ